MMQTILRIWYAHLFKGIINQESSRRRRRIYQYNEDDFSLLISSC